MPRANQKPSPLHRTWVGALLAVACLYFLLPVAWAVISSLKSVEEIYTYPPGWFSSPRWSNFTQALTRFPLLRFLLNSLVITVPSVIGAVLTSSMVGFALARLSFRGRSFCFGVVVTTFFVPTSILLIPRYLLFDALGWIDTYKPLVVPAWLGGGAFNIFLFRQFFRGVPRELEDAAVMDGASPWVVYLNVFLPVAKPAVVAASLMSFVYHWQSFLDPLLYLSDVSTFPVSVGLQMYSSQAGPWMNLLMAASLIALIPVLVLFVVAERLLVRSEYD